MKGVVHYWSSDRAYGKLIGVDDVVYFVHASELTGVRELTVRQQVEFDATYPPRGPRAIRVRVLSPAPAKS